MPIWQLCANLLIPNCLRSNLSYSPLAALELNVNFANSTGLGTLGRMAVYYAKLNPYELAVADSHVTVIRLFKPFMSPLFFYFYFANPTVQSVIEDKSDGSTKQKELSTTTICNYLVPIPPRNEQKRIISKVTSLLPVIEKYGT